MRKRQRVHSAQRGSFQRETLNHLISNMKTHDKMPDKYGEPDFSWLEKTNQEKHLATIKKNMSNPNITDEIETLRHNLEVKHGRPISEEELQDAIDEASGPWDAKEEEIF